MKQESGNRRIGDLPLSVSPFHRFLLLCPHQHPLPGWLAHRRKKHHALTRCVRREEGRHVIIKERQPGGTELLAIGREVAFAADDRSFDLRGTVAAIAEALQDWP